MHRPLMPNQITVELTNQCNSRCPSCLRKYSKRPLAEHMSLDLLSKIVEETRTLGDLIVPFELCGIGEPMLHPQFGSAPKIVQTLPGWSLATNGEVMDEHLDEIMDAKPAEIAISIDAASKETHSMMRVGLHYERIVQNTLALIERCRKTDKFWNAMYIQLIVSAINQHEVLSFVSFWLDKIQGIEGFQVFIKPLCPWPEHRANEYYGHSYNMDIPSHPQLNVGNLSTPVRFAPTCQLMERFVQIHSDGVFSMCCMDSDDVFGIGNVKDHGIVELFNSARANELRNNIRKGNHAANPFCKTCI